MTWPPAGHDRQRELFEAPPQEPIEPPESDPRQHDCLDHLTERADDPALPPHIVPYECDKCGEWWEFDTETGEHRRDN